MPANHNSEPSGDKDFDEIGVEVLDAAELVLIMYVSTDGTMTFRTRLSTQDTLECLEAATMGVMERGASGENPHD